MQRRADKLRVKVFAGLKDKRAALPEILRQFQVSMEQVAYFGDDVNDVAAMDAILPAGLVGAPADARAQVLEHVHHRTDRPGGHGAFRDFAEWLIGLRQNRT